MEYLDRVLPKLRPTAVTFLTTPRESIVVATMVAIMGALSCSTQVSREVGVEVRAGTSVQERVAAARGFVTDTNLYWLVDV